MPKKKTANNILDAAYRLACEKGISELTMRDIAREANVVPSQLTYYYKTKENLLCSLISHILESNESEMTAAVSHGKSAEEKTELLSAYIRNELSQNKPLANLVLDTTLRASRNSSFKTRIADMYHFTSRFVCCIVGLGNASVRETEKLMKRILTVLYETAVKNTLDIACSCVLENQ